VPAAQGLQVLKKGMVIYMHTKIIFFDIDGTILSHRNHQILDSTKAAIRKAKANGHLVFINSGRTFSEIDDEIMGIGFDGYVCGCGTYINYHGSVLLHNTIPHNLSSRLIQDLRELEIEALLEGTDTVYYDDKASSHNLLPPKDVLEKLHFRLLSWDTPNIIFDKFCIWCNDPDKYHLFYSKYKDMFDFMDRDNGMYEIIPSGHSKASGIEFLISYLNIPHDNTYAFGDGVNDLPMLKYVKHSIGMGNSDGGVPEIVSFLTRDVDQDGVDYALKHYKII